MLSPAAGFFGYALVTVTATDLSGHAASDTFRVQVDPTGSQAMDVVIGSGHPGAVSYVDPDRSSGIVSLSGPGVATVHFGGVGVKLQGSRVTGSNVLVMGIDLSGTTAASQLTVKGRGGKDNAIFIGGFDDTGALGSATLIRSVVADVTIEGGVGTFRCDFANSGTLNLGAPLPHHNLQILVGAMFDENVVTTALIQQIRSFNWYNTDSVSESVQAPLLRKLIAFGNFTPGIQLTGVAGQRAPWAAACWFAARSADIGSSPAASPPSPSAASAQDFNASFPTPLRLAGCQGNLLRQPDRSLNWQPDD